jgi:hypothetical protein
MNEANKKHYHLKYRPKSLDLNLKKYVSARGDLPIRKHTGCVTLVACKIIVARGLVNLAL